MSTSPTAAPVDSSEVRERVKRFADAQNLIRSEVHKVIVGQDEVIESVLISLFVEGTVC